MSELTPITRIESYLDAIVNSSIPPTEDITRIETFLQAIYDNQVCQLTPITRIEMFLGKISGQDIVLPEPITWIELYLAAIAGEDVELPENPITRIEMYLAEWADSGDWTTISGAIVEFITQRAHKLKSCVVTLEPQQDLSHGDPSPTNICPISGWDGVTVYDTGHNVWDEEWEVGAYNANGTPSAVTDRIRCKNPISVKPQTSYYFYCPNSTYWFYLFFDSEMNPLQTTVPMDTTNKAVTAPDNAAFMLFYLAAAYGTTYNHDISFNYPSSDTEYHAYSGNSYSVTWEDELFGGSAEVVEGVRRKTKGKIDLGTLTYTYADTYKIFIATLSGVKDTGDSNVPAMISSMYKPISWTTGAVDATMDGIMCILPTYNQLRIRNLGYTDPDAFKAAMSGQQLVYDLATPVETTITPTPITALKGYNAMWSDGDSIEVTVHGTPVEVETLQALNMLLGGAYRNDGTADDVSDDEALDIILGGEQR